MQKIIMTKKTKKQTKKGCWAVNTVAAVAEL